MKTKILVAILAMTFLIVNFTSCNKDTNTLPGTIRLNASATSAGVKSAAIQTAAGTVALQTAAVEIQNVTIEENTGNDNENNNADGGKDNEGKDNEKNSGKDNEKKSQENDGGDVVLAGPYVLDIINGAATIDQVSVQPGNYKKVDFDFVAGPENSGNSILIKGEYTSSAGVTVPFELTSDLSATVQLPLTKNISVSSGSTVSVSIVFDVQNWLSGLDFENATVTGNKILINAQQNTSLYNSFITAVNQHIQVED